METTKYIGAHAEYLSRCIHPEIREYFKQRDISAGVVKFGEKINDINRKLEVVSSRNTILKTSIPFIDNALSHVISGYYNQGLFVKSGNKKSFKMTFYLSYPEYGALREELRLDQYITIERYIDRDEFREEMQKKLMHVPFNYGTTEIREEGEWHIVEAEHMTVRYSFAQGKYDSGLLGNKKCWYIVESKRER